MVRRKQAAIVCLLVLTALMLDAVNAQPLPETGRNAHEGVASCATSVCHGKVSPDDTSVVSLNEYRTWLRKDYHSRAYRTLQSDQSKAIASKLGLPSAMGAKICLDCHADNVAEASRGRRFQISDGVGCEACHGGAGQWLESHAEEATSHADNVAKGMYPTEQPVARARLCLSCHLGTRDKFATHQIMGAGHPRLAFELETFTVNQPAHYQVDADYSQRKPAIDSVNMWLVGLAVSSLQTLELLQEEWFTGASVIPELSFYQCHACHHPMGDLRWEKEGDDLALPPGAVRLNDASLVVLSAVLQHSSKPNAERINAGIEALHQASMVSKAQVVKQAKELHATVLELTEPLESRSYTQKEMRELREVMLRQAAGGRFRHFTSAEQVFLAVETLCLSLGEQDKYASSMDAWFQSLKSQDEWVPKQYAALARVMLENL